MKTYQAMQLRRFPVRLQNRSTGEISEDTITFSIQQLQAAQMVGQSSKELICRAYGREGFAVLDVGKAHKMAVELDLDDLYLQEDEARYEREKAEWMYLYGHMGRVVSG